MKAWSLIKSCAVAFALCFALVATFDTPIHAAEDATFSAAPVASATPKSAIDTAPVKAPDAAAPNSFGWLFSNPLIWILVMAFLRAESAIQAKTKVDLSMGNGLAHTVYGLLKDKGVIGVGNFTNAMDQFWAELDRQSQEHYGKATTPAVQDAAHATFAQLLNSGSAQSVTRATMTQAASAPVPMIRNV